MYAGGLTLAMVSGGDCNPCGQMCFPSWLTALTNFIFPSKQPWLFTFITGPGSTKETQIH